MRAFVLRRGRYIAELDATERSILARVVADTATLLGDPPPEQQAPDDGGSAAGDAHDGGGAADDDAHDGGGAADDDGPAHAVDAPGDDETSDDDDATSGDDAAPADDAGSADDADSPDDDAPTTRTRAPDSGTWSGQGHGPARTAPHGTGAARESLEDQLSRLGKDVPEPTDPALARLLPSASHDDDELAREFRRLTQDEIRNDKITRLRMVWAALRAPGTKLSIDPDQAMDWAAALTDVRLVLSERLGIGSDEDAEEIYALAGRPRGKDANEEDDLRMALASVYSAFTWLQESLVQVMLPTLED